MKKLYLWTLAMLAALCCSFNASAYTVNISWNEAGAIKLYRGSIAAENEINVSGQTSYTFEYESSQWVYVTPAEGYVFEEILEPGSTTPKTSFSVNSSWGQFYGKYLISSQDGKDLQITTKKLVRNASLTVNVENGANYISGYFHGPQQPISLSDGTQTLKFDPEVETGLTLTLAEGKSLDQFYSVKYNGTDVNKISSSSFEYEINNIADGGKLDIRVFEGEAPVEVPASVTLEYAAGLEECLKLIFNWATYKMITPENNRVEVIQGQELAFTFKNRDDGFDITDILVNGVSGKTMEGVQYSSAEDVVSIRFVVKEDVTLKVVGGPATYDDVPMTAYVMNPEGVIITAGKYGALQPVETTETALTQSITLPSQPYHDQDGSISYTKPSFTLTTDNSKVLSFTVQKRKDHNVYVAPKEGWYIATVQGSDKTELNYVDKEYDHTFYVVALPLTNDKTATINVNLPEGSYYGFRANSISSESWDNPFTSYTLENNTPNVIKFTEGYHTPFTLDCYTEGINCMVDNRVLAAPTDPEAMVSYFLDLVDGSIVEVSSTDFAANAYPITLTETGGKTATFTYGQLNRTGASGYNLLSGTTVSLRPTSDDCRITVNGAVVYSPNNNVNLLKDGAYTFNIKEATTVTVGPDAQFVKITKTNPVDGQRVASFETLVVSLPALDNMGERMFGFDEAALSTVKVTSAAGKAVEATYIEPSPSDYLITFEFMDQPGDYTITIPSGFFYEIAWDEATEANVKVEGGASTEAFTSTFTIDPEAPTFHLIPAYGSTVSDLSKVRIVFPGAQQFAELPEGFNVAGITLTGAGFSTTVYEVSEVMNSEHVSFDIFFDAAPSVAGEYTVTLPDGAFLIDGWKESEAFNAVYDFKPAYVLTPTPGSTIKETTFTISFPEATNVAISGSVFDFTLSAGNAWAAPQLEVTELEGAEVPAFTISLPADAEAAPFGKLTLNINEGAFTIDGIAGPAISATYNYEGQVSTEYQVEPSGNFIVVPTEDWGSVMWTFLFDEAATVQGVRGTINGASVTVNNNPVAYEASAEGNMLLMQLSSKEGLTDGDVLRVQIPAGAFTLSGQESPAIDRSWTLANAKTYTWATNPANNSTIGTLESFTLTFTEEATGEQPTSGTVNEGRPFADVKQGYETVGKANIAWVKGGEFKVTIEEPIKTAGTYSVDFTYGTFLFDGCQTFDAHLTVNFTIDPALGITDISVAGTEKATVVTLDGRVIVNADINSLPAGIYIINGKKTLVK